MTATIISIKNGIMLVESSGKIYSAEKHIGFKCKVGDKVEFSISAEPKFFSFGKAVVKSLLPFNYQGKCSVSFDLTVPQHRISEYRDDPVLCGEGATLEDALSALEELALKSGGNAILDLKITPIMLKFRKGCLYRVTGFAAAIERDSTPQAQAKNQLLSFGPVRRNSKNLVKIRYLRMMLCYVLLIAIPCLLKISLSQGLSAQATYFSCIILVLAALCLSFKYFPKKREGYLIVRRKRFAV